MDSLNAPESTGVFGLIEFRPTPARLTSGQKETRPKPGTEDRFFVFLAEPSPNSVQSLSA
jgi:hypothetical protein